MFKPNLDRSGRYFRGFTALLLLIYAWFAASWIALFAGLFVLFEAWMNWCLFLQIFGKDHCPKP